MAKRRGRTGTLESQGKQDGAHAPLKARSAAQPRGGRDSAQGYSEGIPSEGFLGSALGKALRSQLAEPTKHEPIFKGSRRRNGKGDGRP